MACPETPVKPKDRQPDRKYGNVIRREPDLWRSIPGLLAAESIPVEAVQAGCHRSESLDASNLMMPLVFFMSPSDPRMLKTLDALNQSPANGGLVSNSLVHRYNVEETADGLRGEEGTFNICTLAPRLSWYSPV